MWVSKKRFEALEKSLKEAHEELDKLKEKTVMVVVPFDNPDDVTHEIMKFGYRRHVTGEDCSIQSVVYRIIEHLGITYVTGKKTPGYMEIKEKKKGRRKNG